MNRSIPLGLVASALALSGCSQLGIGASEPDEATRLAMEACSIEVVEGDGADGDAEGSGYERARFGSGDNPWSPIDDDLERLEFMEERWHERAISSRAASRLDDQWNDLAGWFAENHQDISGIVSYRRADDTPTWEELSSQHTMPSDIYNTNLDRIDVECGALLRTLDSAQ